MGSTDRDGFVVPPQESQGRERVLWLLLTASYGLVNANATWQVISDQILADKGFETFHSMPQLFTMITSSSSGALLAIIINDILLCGPGQLVDQIIECYERSLLLEL